jgi:hypothetical protein
VDLRAGAAVREQRWKFFGDLTARLLWYAEREFTLRKPLRNGGTIGDAFALYEKKTRRRHPEDKPACGLPIEIEYLWAWYWEIAEGRPQNGNGLLPIPAMEIKAWADLAGVTLKPWEMRALRALDRLLIDTMSKKDAE